jgi:hypothetical protein
MLSEVNDHTLWRQCQPLAASRDKRLGQPRTVLRWTPAPDIAHQDSARRGFAKTTTPEISLPQFTERNLDLVGSRLHHIGEQVAETPSKAPLIGYRYRTSNCK